MLFAPQLPLHLSTSFLTLLEQRDVLIPYQLPVHLLIPFTSHEVLIRFQLGTAVPSHILLQQIHTPMPVPPHDPLPHWQLTRDGLKRPGLQSFGQRFQPQRVGEVDLLSHLALQVRAQLHHFRPPSHLSQHVH